MYRFMKSKGINVGITNYLLVVRQYEGRKFVFDTGNDNRIILEKKVINLPLFERTCTFILV